MFDDDDDYDDLADQDQPDDPFPASPPADATDTAPPERPDGAAYPGWAGCIVGLGVPIALFVMLIGMLLPGDTDPCAFGSRPICHSVVFWLPVEALGLEFVLFCTGAILASQRPGVRERGTHWAFFLVGVAVFLVACCVFLGLAKAAVP